MTDADRGFGDPYPHYYRLPVRDDRRQEYRVDGPNVGQMAVRGTYFGDDWRPSGLVERELLDSPAAEVLPPQRFYPTIEEAL